MAYLTYRVEVIRDPALLDHRRSGSREPVRPRRAYQRRQRYITNEARLSQASRTSNRVNP